MTSAVLTADLSKTYGEGETEVRALRDVSVEIPLGEFVVLLGASGPGKTTFLNQIGALEAPTAGSSRPTAPTWPTSTTRGVPTTGCGRSASSSSPTTWCPH